MATHDDRNGRPTRRTYKSSDVHKRRVGDASRSKPAKMPTRREARESARETMRISAASRSGRSQSEETPYDEKQAAVRSVERPHFVVIKNETPSPAESSQATVRVGESSQATARVDGDGAASNAARSHVAASVRADVTRPLAVDGPQSGLDHSNKRSASSTAVAAAETGAADAQRARRTQRDQAAQGAQGKPSMRDRLGETLKLDQATKLIQRINPAAKAAESDARGEGDVQADDAAAGAGARAAAGAGARAGRASRRASAQTGDASSGGSVSRKSAFLTPKRIAIIAVAALIVIGVAAFAFNRWGRFDDRADIQGTWYVLGTEVPVTIDGDVIRFNEDVAYQYEIDPREKTIKYTFGPMEGQGRYWFSADRKYLVITDGDGYTATSTTVDDLIHAFLDFSTATGGGVVELPRGEGIIAFSRTPEPLAVNPPAEGLVVEKPDAQSGQSGQSAQGATSSDGASRSAASASAESSGSAEPSADDVLNGDGQPLDEGYYGGTSGEGSANGTATGGASGYDEPGTGESYYEEPYDGGSYYDETYYGEPTYDETATYDEEEAV